MILTPHQAKYFAHDLTRRAVDSMARPSMSPEDFHQLMFEMEHM